MTNWLPDLRERRGPRYLAIAEALAVEVGAGRLPPGARLPTHRELAYGLGVTVGTVTRGYAEARRRGLIEAAVGRGTYVRESRTPGPAGVMPEFAERADGEPAPIALNLATPPREDGNRLLANALSALARRDGVAALLDYQPHGGAAGHRAAGAAWIGRAGIAVPADQVIVTAGAQHAMTVAFAALTAPGEVVLTEALTYPGMKAVASFLHLRLHGVAMDEHGLIPEAFEAACRTGRPKALYILTTVQNPTGAVMPEERRREIARIAGEHQVAIVEDDIYGFLAEGAPPPLVRHAPRLGYYLTSVSKQIAPGLRIGFLAPPPSGHAACLAAMRATTWMAPPLTAEIAAGWIADGTAERLGASRRAESVARQRLAREMLAGFDYRAHPAAYHGWLTLPEPWRAAEFVVQARARGVLVTAVEAFAVSRPGPQAVRLCLSGARDRAELTRGLDLLVGVLRGPSDQHLSIV